MSSVHLVADSTCDLSAADAQQAGLSIVPLKVIVGEEVFGDGVDIDPATLYARMRTSPVVPRTSQPTPAEFESVFLKTANQKHATVGLSQEIEVMGHYFSSPTTAADAPRPGRAAHA